MTTKILFFSSFGDYLGGGQRSLYVTLKHLSGKVRFEPLLAVPSEGKFAEDVRKLGIGTLIAPLCSFSISNIRRVKGTLKLLSSQIREKDIHILVCDGPRPCVYALLLKIFCAAKVVLHARVSDRFFIFDYLFCFFLDGIIAVSDSVLNRFPGYVKKKVKLKVIYNAVDKIEPSPAGGRGQGEGVRFSDGGNEIVIGFAGQLIEKKGIYDIPLLARELEKRKMRYKILVAGKGEEAIRERLEKKIEEAGLGKTVKLPGWIEDMSGYYEMLDFLFFPTYFPEGLPRTILEAQAHSVPVIAYESPGTTEIIENGVTGFIIKKGDIKAATDCLQKCISDPEIYASMRRAAYENIRDRFSAERHISEISAFLLDLIKK